MPSTYTVNLGIQKPATGEQSGTWGNTTNANFDILDQGINGALRLTLTSAGSSGSPNALAINEGSVSDGHNKWIEFYSSSDLGGNVFVQLTPNDAEKIVFVRNSLAGSRSVLLFQGTYNSGRDLEIPAGVDMVVKFSGGGASAATVTDVYTKLRATEITTPSLTATTADINGGTIDNSVIGGSTAAAVTGTAIVANTSLNIAGDGATVTGIKDEDNMASNSATKLATQQSIKAYVDAQVGTADTLSEVLVLGNTTGGTDIAVSANDHITFTDSSRAKFGASSDLVIFHDGTNSYIQDNGTGDLILRGSSNISLQAAGGTVGANFAAAAAVTLNHAGNQKLITTSTGINVTGNVEFDGLSGTGSVTVTDILDEDNMASNSATKLATQQSIKSYVDTQVATIPTGDITGVTAGTGLTGGGTSGTVTLNLGTAGAGAGTYGSTSNTTKIDQITLDAYGRVTAVTTGATGDITGVTAGTQLTGGGTSGTVTLNVSQGAGSGLDADTLDGVQGSSYLRSDTTDYMNGNLVFADNARLQIGTNTDLQLFHDGSNSYVREAGTGVLFMDSDDIHFRNGAGTNTLMQLSSDVLTMQGQLQMNGNIINDVEDIYLRDKMYHDADTDTYMGYATNTINFVTGGTNRLQVNDSAVTVAGVLSVGGAIDLIDNKVLRFGSSDDVEFFFSGSHMYTDLNLGDWYIRDGTTNRFLFNDNGDFHADANIFAYSTSVGSDRKLKDNIELIGSPLEKIQKLNGVTFNWKRDGEASAGVIAQDVQKVLPSAVKEVKQLSNEGEDSTRLNVDYNQIIGLLVESVKELKKEIEELKKGK